MKNIDNGTIALIGGGPAALFMLKHLVGQDLSFGKILIFEKRDRLGVGMPYGKFGAEKEHVANVSANELPQLSEDFESFMRKFPTEEFGSFCEDGKINPYEVIPRRLLGDYLEYSFKRYIDEAKSKGISIEVHLETSVLDIIPEKGENTFKIYTENERYHANTVILCTGHVWPKIKEDKIPGWFDSPYPPAKLSLKANFPVAVRGASLTAVDAIKTLARANGSFEKNEDGSYAFSLNEDSPDFRIDLFSLRGFLPALRFHSEDDAFSTEWTMSLDEIHEYKQSHGGFVDLDYVFEINFKKPLQQKDPEFYEKIKDLSIEEFVDEMLKIRNELDSFQLFRAEFQEAEKSIHRHQSVSWKEALSAFSYAMNYPAKHFSAEDMARHKKVLMPLISVIIASLPQSSYHEIMALHNQNLLDNYAVGEKSEVVPNEENGGCTYKFIDENGNEVKKQYGIFVDAVGQKPMLFNDLPFDGLKKGIVSSGYLYFKDDREGKTMEEGGDKNVGHDSTGKYFTRVPGLAINDFFQAVDFYGAANPNLFIMAVPFIGGLNPDYSGLDFCDTAGERIAQSLREGLLQKNKD